MRLTCFYWQNKVVSRILTALAMNSAGTAWCGWEWSSSFFCAAVLSYIRRFVKLKSEVEKKSSFPKTVIRRLSCMSHTKDATNNNDIVK